MIGIKRNAPRKKKPIYEREVPQKVRHKTFWDTSRSYIGFWSLNYFMIFGIIDRFHNVFHTQFFQKTFPVNLYCIK